MTENFIGLGYFGLAVAGFIAGSAIPFSSEAAMSTALALGWNKWLCVTFLLIGNWLGAATNYWIGHSAKIKWIEKYLHISPSKIEKTQRFLKGKGVWLATISFLPFFGNALIVCYGLSRTPFWQVGILMFIGRLLRYLVWMWLTEWAIITWFQ